MVEGRADADIRYKNWNYNSLRHQGSHPSLSKTLKVHAQGGLESYMGRKGLCLITWVLMEM